MDTQDTSPSVLLFFDKQRFIFNAGEVKLSAIFYKVCSFLLVSGSSLTGSNIELQGLQRFCTEHKIKLSKVLTVSLFFV